MITHWFTRKSPGSNLSIISLGKRRRERERDTERVRTRNRRRMIMEEKVGMCACKEGEEIIGRHGGKKAGEEGVGWHRLWVMRVVGGDQKQIEVCRDEVY